MHKDIHAYYRALGLSEGAGPAEIRRAYRHMVQTWHPDLFKPGSPMQMTAEDITKEVNEAYEQLFRKKLYRRFPHKPGPEGEAGAPAMGEHVPRAADEGAEGSGEPARAGAGRRPPEGGPARPGWWARPWDWKRFRPSRRLPWKWAAIAAGMGLAAYAAGPTVVGLLKRPPPGAEAEPLVVQESGQPAPPALGRQGPPIAPERRAGAPARPARPAPQARTPTARAQAGAWRREIRHLTSYDSIRDSVRPARQPETGDLARLFEKAGALLEVFDVGDSKARVLAVQGTPDDAGETVFRYGSSLVYFDRGRVTGWTDRVPWLHVRPWSERSLASLDTFSLASTRGDVIRAQGEPSAVTPHGYFYGSSYVVFENDVVAGWSQGDVNLRSFDIPILPFLDLDRMALR